MEKKKKKYKGICVDTDEAFVCDTRSDITNLPDGLPQGSSAFVIEDSTTWMIDSSGQWQQTIVGGGGDITTISLDITKNGTYIAPAGKAYKRVVAEVNDIPEIPTDGSIHIKAHFDAASQDRMVMRLWWKQSDANGVTVNWGDGSADETFNKTGAVSATHTYQLPGDYEISMSAVSGTLTFDSTNGTGSNAVYGPKGNTTNYWKTKITEISFGDDVESVGSYCLQYCYSLNAAGIANGVTSIGDGAFSYCYALTAVSLPSGLTTIGNDAFYYCHSLKDIVIPDTVTSIGTGAFQNCLSLKSVTIPSSVREISKTSFSNCYNLRNIIIPDRVTSIGSDAFGNCYAMTSVTIPASVTSIGSDAFAYCGGVREYHIKSETPPTLGNTGVFVGMAPDCVIYVPYSSDHSILNAYKSATNWSSFASKMQEESL